jgi:ABC-type glycerol-3-phosphate transport system substrate-binding protein
MIAGRTLATAVAAAIVLAACGGNGSTSDDGTRPPAPPDEVAVAADSDVVANQLPDVVVDDVTLGNKVNLRNVAPADTPILLWMWAPH